MNEIGESFDDMTLFMGMQLAEDLDKELESAVKELRLPSLQDVGWWKRNSLVNTTQHEEFFETIFYYKKDGAYHPFLASVLSRYGAGQYRQTIMRIKKNDFPN